MRAEYDALEDEFALIAQLIEARARAGLRQAEVAERMGTQQAAVARLEGGRMHHAAAIRAGHRRPAGGAARSMKKRCA